MADFLDSDDEKLNAGDDVGASQTQQDVKMLISDIFGDSDEEEPTLKVPSEAPKFDLSDDDDNIFADSDEEKAPKLKGRLQQKGSKKIGPASKIRPEDLVDSDDEDFSKKSKKRKGKEISGKNKKIRKKKDSKKKDESGDEYDSGEEVKATKDDIDFIDKDDEHADLVREYDEDAQDFDDMRPDKKKSSKSSAQRSGGGSSGNAKASDPLSQVLVDMKAPKVKGLSDADKEMIVEKLQKKMDKAVALDNQCFLKKEPAIYKLQLLPAVQRALSMKALHHVLMERDILQNLQDWIQPRDKNTLPALQVRSTIYELLLRLPCNPEYLKRVSGNRQPIGATIVALRKHKMETAENKRVLRDIMDKWSRPVFSKHVDERGSGGAGILHSDNPEIQAAVLARFAAQQREEEALRAAAAGRERTAAVPIGAIMSGESAMPSQPRPNDHFNRVRVPFSQGFLFTVQPEMKQIDKRDVMEKSLGEGRMKLFKKMSEGRSAVNSEGLGKKINPRAMSMSVSGGGIKG